MKVDALLRIEGVVAGYGRGDILRGLDLTLESGTVTCLVGPNGAGKSTGMKTLSGLLRPREGRILLDGSDICRRSPAQVLELGVVHVAQERSLFPLMTVWDNLLMGGHVMSDRTLVRRRADAGVSQRVTTPYAAPTIKALASPKAAEVIGFDRGRNCLSLPFTVCSAN